MEQELATSIICSWSSQPEVEQYAHLNILLYF